jgi:hypothetical protein
VFNDSCPRWPAAPSQFIAQCWLPSHDCPLTGCHSLSLALSVNSKSKSCYDRRSVGQCVLVSSTHLGLKTRFLLLSDSCRFVHVGRPLWREDGSVVYNCCWPSPAQSFSGPSPVGLATILYCLRLETSPPWRARSPYLYPPGTEWPRYTPPRALVLLSVASYDLQGDIRTRLHTGCSHSSQSQSHIATVSQSVSLGVEPHLWLMTRDIYYCLTVTVLLLWGALSDERTDLSIVRVIVFSSKSFVIM